MRLGYKTPAPSVQGISTFKNLEAKSVSHQLVYIQRRAVENMSGWIWLGPDEHSSRCPHGRYEPIADQLERLIEENRQNRERRPIPVNTMEWVSTSSSQMTAISGTQFLNDVEQLEIQQIIDLNTLLGRVKRRFHYRVKVPRAETLFLAMDIGQTEETGSWNCSKLFREYFTLNVLDQSGQKAFTMIVRSRIAYMIAKLHSIKVMDPNFIGIVEQNYRLVGVCFTVYDAEKKELCHIEGPNISTCCTYPETHFKVMSLDGSHQIASLMHLWDSILREYILLVTFTKELDVKLKSLLLAAAFLMEYVYFKEEASSEGRVLFPTM